MSKKDFKILEAEKREGDPAVLISRSEKAIETLKWKPQYEGIEIIIETAWKWHQKTLSL